MDRCWIWALDSLGSRRPRAMDKVREWLDVVIKYTDQEKRSEAYDLDLILNFSFVCHTIGTDLMIGSRADERF